MNTTPPPMPCQHEQIQTWRDPEGVPRMWSCVDCKKKFEPIGPWMERIKAEQGMRQYYSEYANLITNEKLDLQKRITALEAENARLREVLKEMRDFYYKPDEYQAMARTALESKHD